MSTYEYQLYVCVIHFAISFFSFQYKFLIQFGFDALPLWLWLLMMPLFPLQHGFDGKAYQHSIFATQCRWQYWKSTTNTSKIDCIKPNISTLIMTNTFCVRSCAGIHLCVWVCRILFLTESKRQAFGKTKIQGKSIHLFSLLFVVLLKYTCYLWMHFSHAMDFDLNIRRHNVCACCCGCYSASPIWAICLVCCAFELIENVKRPQPSVVA